MRKLIMFVFLLLSLATMIAFTFSLNELFTLFGLGVIDWDDILSLIEDNSIEDILPTLGVVLGGLFQLYGMPLLVFLVSLNGLAIKS